MFFNGGSAYSLYDVTLNPGKIILNTMLGGSFGGLMAYLFKSRIHNVGGCLKTTIYHHYDGASICNGILAGLVAITAPCDAVN